MKLTSPSRLNPGLVAAAVWLTSAVAVPLGFAATPMELLEGFTAQAGAPPLPDRGERLFTTTQGRRWSCASCHGELPVQTGRHAATNKAIAPLAPAANAERFTDLAKVEKWFRHNCNDVLARARPSRRPTC